MSALKVLRDSLWRALLTCTTCGEVVCVGRTTSRGPHWACFELGIRDGETRSAMKHFGKCGGGALQVSLEQLANPPSFPPPATA